MYELQLEVEWKDASQSKAIFESIRPELKTDDFSRARIDAIHIKNKHIITIKAEDLIALRAAMNSLLRLLMLSEEILD